MRVTLEDFRRLALKNNKLEAKRIIKYVPESKRLELVMNGAVYNRATDKEYVLDNVESRATHVDMQENEDVVKSICPEVMDIISEGNIDIPPGEFYLMQDIYQLPDSGDWNTKTEVPRSDVAALEVCEHMYVHIHEGSLIDNHMINSLRRRTSYFLKDDVFYRSRDNKFKVRRRPSDIMLVVDDAKMKEQLEKLVTKTPYYRGSFYVIKDAGVNLKKLDKGDVEHIGIIRHLINQDTHPDIILFEPKREKQLQKTESTIMQSNTRISSKFRFKGVKCGQLDMGISVEGLHDELMRFCNESISEVKGSGDTTAGEVDDTSKKNSSFMFNIKPVIHDFSSICKSLGLDDAKIKTKINGYVLKSSQLVLQLVETKWLVSLNSNVDYTKMSSDEVRAAANKYMSSYPDRVSQVRSSILYELLIKDTLVLYEVTYKNRLGEEAKDAADKKRAEIDGKILARLRHAYAPSDDSPIGDQELRSLYQRDYNKLLNQELIRFYAKELGIS